MEFSILKRVFYMYDMSGKTKIKKGDPYSPHLPYLLWKISFV